MPRKLAATDAAAALLSAAVYELQVGQSSVKLTIDSKGSAKPEVHCYAKTARAASKMAQSIFDELVLKYCAPATH